MAKIGNRNIYLTQEEIDALRTATINWLYEEEKKHPEEAQNLLDKGLGSAMRKLHEGLGKGKFFNRY